MSGNTPQVGQLVRILKGKDAGEVAVVIAVIDSRFVFIADGEKRKFDGPKKKNIQHLELIPFVASEIVNSLQETGRVTNGKLRFAVAKYGKPAVISAD
ncbi:KOW domain-containing RNA-binding protein [Paenibacillus sp. NFR01]|uniref:KOW domain-containing RNA-binding protein n=1 Tax=Paenibacillus sp. NFR01 TaxID=1566279 RepID=UPI0008AFD3BE|nr:KOW domain-containing RNA-binding protein [Paenibacillus sp. NFR01]SEU30944.1 Ribosomal protein L14E/L6E/L27E [Paenibacillus sp. NFR01]